MGKESKRKRVDICDMYNWFTLLYTWSKHNIVNQLYSNRKKLFTRYIYELWKGRHQKDRERGYLGLTTVGTESIRQAEFMPICQCLRIRKINLSLTCTYWKSHTHFPPHIPYNKSQFLIHSRKGCQTKCKTLSY